MFVLVISAPLEEAIALMREKLHDHIEVIRTYNRPNETIVHIEEPIGHDIWRWFHEGDSRLIWFNAPKGE